MPKYKVKVIAVSGLKNAVHKFGAIVTDKHFPEGRAEILVEGGHLEPLQKVVDDSPQLIDVPGVGKATVKRLNLDGIHSVRELAEADADALIEAHGDIAGEWINKAQKING